MRTHLMYTRMLPLSSCTKLCSFLRSIISLRYLLERIRDRDRETEKKKVGERERGREREAGRENEDKRDSETCVFIESEGYRKLLCALHANTHLVSLTTNSLFKAFNFSIRPELKDAWSDFLISLRSLIVFSFISF